MAQYGSEQDESPMPPQHTQNTHLSHSEKTHKKKRTGKLPPKLSETVPGACYTKNSPAFLAEVCPNMVGPLIAAAELRGKDRQCECVSVCVCLSVCLSVYVYLSMCLCVCLCVCVCLSVCVCVSVCLFICLSFFLYIYIPVSGYRVSSEGQATSLSDCLCISHQTPLHIQIPLYFYRYLLISVCLFRVTVKMVINGKIDTKKGKLWRMVEAARDVADVDRGRYVFFLLSCIAPSCPRTCPVHAPYLPRTCPVHAPYMSCTCPVLTRYCNFLLFFTGNFLSMCCVGRTQGRGRAPGPNVYPCREEP